MMQPRAAEGFALPPAFLLLFRYRQTLLLQSAFQNKRVSLSNTQKVSKGKSRDLFANRVESFFDGMYSRFSTCFTERALSSFVEIRCIKKFGKNANLGCSENRFFFYLFFTEKSMNLKKASPPEREREREREAQVLLLLFLFLLCIVALVYFTRSSCHATISRTKSSALSSRRCTRFRYFPWFVTGPRNNWRGA